MSPFKLHSEYEPAGDQPEAIRELVGRARSGDDQFQVLLGVTGSGKTFTMANVIRDLNKPTLILTHNKTLAAQLYQEFKNFFPENAVEYFVSYYDYYQPEAYVVRSDTFIEKDASINDEIDKLRMRATVSLLTRKDVIVVASVSCIYGLGAPEVYRELTIRLKTGQEIERDTLLRDLVNIQYARNDIEVSRGTFRVRGDVVEILPSYDDYGLRIEFFGDEIEQISRIHVVTGEIQEILEETLVAPARHFVTREEGMDRILHDIRQEMTAQVKYFEKEDRPLEAQRISSRTRYDMEMLKETGHCSGIENYSRIIENRPIGSRPSTLLDFFGDDWLMFIDESHVSIPQVGGMFQGDRNRKETLVEYGFRLPCALDNRPMNFTEFEGIYPPSVVFVSATPGDYEMEKSAGTVVEQVIRPTGLLDPEVEILPATGQISALLERLGPVIERGERILVTTLTKKMAEDLTEFLAESGISVRYMHSEIDTLQRAEIIRDLRKGSFDVLVGINLLREGLDLPEVSLVAILDADKEGFLRHTRALIQTMGRAARNANGRVLLFADRITDSIRAAIQETERRRQKQQEHNEEHGIVPRTVIRRIDDEIRIMDPLQEQGVLAESEATYSTKNSADETLSAAELEEKMQEAADKLDFEEAARLRDLLRNLTGGTK